MARIVTCEQCGRQSGGGKPSGLLRAGWQCAVIRGNDIWTCDECVDGRGNR